jgi:glutaredoxin|tara:strand:+ start:729 stop:1013 length:285 start_codon:yes stop_codon:yes gene_type:complete
MDKVIVLFTMKGCPHCVEMKEMLIKEGIDFVDRDIDEYEEEYNMFVEITENEYVPSFMLIENPETEPVSELYAPERDYDDLEDGVGIIKEWLER